MLPDVLRVGGRLYSPATDHDVRLFDLSAPSALPDGSSWSAVLVERDSWYHMTLLFEVTVRRADGRTDAFSLSLVDPADTSGEPAASRQRLHVLICGRLGLRP